MVSHWALLALLLASRACAVPCASWPPENILTSQNCPSACGTNPCVQFSASDAAAATCDASASNCLVEPAFVNSTACELTVQCVRVGVSTWSFDLAILPAARIQNVTYPNDGHVTTVEITSRRGGTDTTDVQIDPSVFSMPASVVNVNLAFNRIRELPPGLPMLETLNLTNNALATIPDPVFHMNKLHVLSLRGCNLTNIHLNASQMAFLTQLHQLEAEFVVSSCRFGSKATRLSSNGLVCVKELTSVTILVASGDTQSSNNTTLITLLIVGGVVVLLMVLGCVFWKCFRHQEKPQDAYVGMEMPISTAARRRSPRPRHDVDTDGFSADGNTLGSSSIWNDPTLLQHRIQTPDLVLTRRLAESDHGEVWCGMVNDRIVVIKRLKEHRRAMDLAVGLAQSVQMYGDVVHPNVVSFVGVTWDKALDIQLLTEYQDGGDLRGRLDLKETFKSMTWAGTKCQVAIDITEVLAFLHATKRPMWPGCLTSRNVLLASDGMAKLSVLQFPRDAAAMNPGSDFQWMAPEAIVGACQNREAVDVYALGVVLTELDTTQRPFHDAMNLDGTKPELSNIIAQVVDGKRRPTVSSKCPKPIALLVENCLAFNPEKRPSAARVAYTLLDILKTEL